MNNEYSIIITTFPDKTSAKKTARLLVEEKKAACAQMFPIDSVYSWQEESLKVNPPSGENDTFVTRLCTMDMVKVCEDEEVLLLIKTRAALYGEVEELIKANHSYDVPEIIQTPITGGLSEYLKWIDDNTDKTIQGETK